MNGRDTPSQGNAHRWHVPHDVYPCRGEDHWIAIDVATDVEFASLCRVLGCEPLAQSPRFATAAARRTHAAELDAAIAAATRDRDKEALFHALQAAGVCAAPTHDPLEALADPQLAARGFFEPLATGDERVPYRYPGLMWRMRLTPNRLRSAPARLGEHNREIYCGLLGYDDSEFAELERRGLVGTRFPESIWKSPSR